MTTIQTVIPTGTLADKVKAVVPSSLAGGQIPQSTILACLQPLVDECETLRKRVAALEAELLPLKV